MRKAFVFIGVIVMLVGMMALPAAADEPDVFTESETFDDINPCSGEVHTVTINFLVSIHDHPDEFLVRVRRTGETSSGYIMGHGKETFSAVDGVVSGQFRDPWNNPDTGEKFEVAGRFLEVDGEVIMDDFRFVCVSGPTILP